LSPPAARQRRGAGRGFGGPGRPGMSMPVERPKDFGNTVRRLGRRLRPESTRIALVISMASGSVAFTVFGPKILGNATDVLFNGVIGKRLPAGMSKLQVIAMLRAKGQGQLADMVRGMSITPGAGVNFDHLDRKSTRLNSSHLVISYA